MKRIFNKINIMLTLALLFGAISAAAIERPFALNGRGIATLSQDASGNLVGNVTGAGTATHLGAWTATGSVTFTTENGITHSHGYAHLSAADGDKLELEGTGVLDPATGIDQGIFTITGGIGRFANATGSTNYIVSLNPLTGGFELTMVGNIDY
jgi:hypothetical protein